MNNADRIQELKIHQLTNQHLIQPADKMTVIRDLCGVQAQFMVNAMHSLKIRCNDFKENTAADGLVKNWTVAVRCMYLPKVICRFSYVAITVKLTEKMNGVAIPFGISAINGRSLPNVKNILLIL